MSGPADRRRNIGGDEKRNRKGTDDEPDNVPRSEYRHFHLDADAMVVRPRPVGHVRAAHDAGAVVGGQELRNEQAAEEGSGPTPPPYVDSPLAALAGRPPEYTEGFHRGYRDAETNDDRMAEVRLTIWRTEMAPLSEIDEEAAAEGYRAGWAAQRKAVNGTLCQ